MKAKLPQPEHYSYLQHRKQRNVQIILPVILSALLFIGMIVLISLATFKQNGDVGRWAAISTIWIIIPALIAGLIFLAVLAGLVYLMARALGALPHYTNIAQAYVYKARGYIVRGADLSVKPILVLNGWLETIKAFFGRITP
ncbi:MAG: hypothetical protein QY332_06110 [Anaerolineales bacterium]|nr:MAG: hypothetical protein QY332_06110 [Anaerolineales bacterium]